MGKYSDLSKAVVYGGEGSEEVLKKRADEISRREALSSELTDSLRKMIAPQSASGGLVQKAIDFAIGAGEGANRPVSQPEAPPTVQRSAPPAPPQEEPVDLNLESPQFYKAKFEGNYYLIPGSVDGKPVDKDTAGELFVTGKLAPVAKSPSLEQIQKEEQSRVTKQVKEEQKVVKAAREATSRVVEGVLDHELDVQQQQFLTNERAVGVMNKYSPAPDFLKNSEHGRMFMRGQAVDALGYLGMKMKNYALQGKELPEEDKKKIKEMQYVAGYKSPEEGSWTQEAAELVGQMYAQMTDSRHNPFIAGLVGTAVGAAATAYTGPGMAITGPMAGLAAGTASAANRSALIEGGNFFLEAKDWKHANGKPISAREAAIATDLVGGLIGAMEVANVGPYLEMFPILNKFASKKAIVDNPGVKSIILNAAKRVAAGATTEATVETMQELPGIVAGAVLQDKDVMKELANPETGKQLAEIFSKVFKGTAVLGGVGAGGRMATDSYDLYKQKRRERLAGAGVDVETETPPPPPPKKERKKKEATQDVDVKPAAPAPEAEAAPAAAPPKQDDTVIPPEAAPSAKPEGPSMVTSNGGTKKNGTVVPPSYVPVDPISTPAAIATKDDGTLTDIIPTPASVLPTIKLEILNTTDEEGFGTVQHDDGTRVMAPKKVWHVTSHKPIKLDWLVRPAYLMNDNSIYEGPSVLPLTDVAEPNAANLNALVKSRDLAKKLAERQQYIFDEKNEEGRPVDVKDVGFVITGPEGTQAAGQPVWVSASLVDQKYKGKYNSLQERLADQKGTKYAESAATQDRIAAEKAEKKNAPLPPLAQDLLKRPYTTSKTQATKGKKPSLTEIAQQRTVKSLSAMGFDKTELESIVQEAVLDAARSVANTPDIDKKTPAQQQGLFFSRLRAFTQDQAKKAKQGGSRRQHQKMRDEGVQTVSIEAAGLENKPVGEGAESQLGVNMAENKVATKVSANTPIKLAQARAEATGANVGKEARPGPVKVYTPEEIEKINRQIGYVVKGRKKATAGKQEVAEIVKKEQTERRSREYVPQTKQENETSFPNGKTTSTLVRQLANIGDLIASKDGVEVEFSTYKAASSQAKKNSGTVIPVTRGGKQKYVVSKSTLGRTTHTYNFLASKETPAPVEKVAESPSQAESTDIKDKAKKKTGKKVGSVPEAQAAIAIDTSVSPQIEPEKSGDPESEAAAAVKNDEEYTHLPKPANLIEVQPVPTTEENSTLWDESGNSKLIDDASRKIAGSLGRAFNWTARALDIEYGWKNKGMEEIGFAIKNIFSRAEVEEKKAQALAIRIDNRMRLLNGGLVPSQQYRLDVVLAAENKEYLNELDPDYSKRVEGPAKMLRDFMDESQKEFEARGITLDFKNRMLGDLDTKIEKEQDAVKKQELEDARKKVETTSFVHIPYRFIFQKAMREFVDSTDPIQRKRKLAEFKSLVDVKRHVLSIRAMIEKKNKAGEYIIDRTNINPVNIILNYGANKGHDHALLDIRDALGSYNNIIKAVKTKPKTTKEGYDWVLINQPKLELLRSLLSKEDKIGKKKLFIRKDAFDALNEVLGYNDKQTKYDKGMALGKMAAFWNPLFLPIYNTLQSIRGMTINPMHPLRTIRSFHKAVKDIGGVSSIFTNMQSQHSADYYEALENGLTSKPFGNPFQQWRKFADQVNGTRSGNALVDSWRAFIAEFKHASPWAKYTLVTPLVKSMYMASWHTAWQIDELFRMASYNYLREYGMNQREAAQVSSALQGDYASIPPKTRKVLNRFLFTPTFKIATLKLYSSLMQSAMKVGWEAMKHPLAFGDKVSMKEKRYAQAAIGVFMVNFAFDMLLVIGLGFDRDEKESFGRRYRKRVVTSEGTTKDLYITLASSENVLQRYAERVRKAFFTPGVENPFTEFVRQNRWELHPVYRNALSAATNQGDDGPIWSNSDKWYVATPKALKYFTFKTINVLDAIQSRTEYAANDKQRALVQKQWVKDFGHGWGTVMNAVALVSGYDYLAAPVEQQMVMKLKQVEKRFRTEAYRSVENTGKVDPALVDWFSKEQQAIVKHYTNRLNEGKK